jgi:hypothetical protein
LAPAVVAGLLSLGAGSARAEDVCLTGFGGFTFWLNFQQVTPVSGLSTGPITGRMTGGVLCGTQGNGIPLDGSASFDGNTLILGFQAHAVEIPFCGSVEFKVILDLETLSGDLDLWNTRMEFENTGTVSLGLCPAFPIEADAIVPGAKDAAGNEQAPE